MNFRWMGSSIHGCHINLLFKNQMQLMLIPMGLIPDWKFTWNWLKSEQLQLICGYRTAWKMAPNLNNRRLKTKSEPKAQRKNRRKGGEGGRRRRRRKTKRNKLDRHTDTTTRTNINSNRKKNKRMPVSVIGWAVCDPYKILGGFMNQILVWSVC